MSCNFHMSQNILLLLPCHTFKKMEKPFLARRPYKDLAMSHTRLQFADLIFSFYPPSRTFFSLLSERGRGEERERDINMKETLTGCLLYMPQLGIKPSTWVCVLMGNQIHDFLAYGMMLQLSHSGPGC